MAPILVAYATTEGHTRKVAEFIAGRLRARGQRAELVDLATAPVPDGSTAYAAVFVGGSVHQHRHQGAMVHFMKANVGWLGKLPVALFSVSLAAAQTDPDSRLEARRLADDCAASGGLRPLRTLCVAGALKYTQYDYLKRIAMRWIAHQHGGDTDTSHDHEYTDWDAVERFVDDFLGAAGLGAGLAVAAADAR
ncbi:flavodoxin domain-containing protein [Rubrivivax sp. RP6-9]|uniref:flavodoxin domain-containing protein n=1 Tax=Rubrivivax sp. RP6-9 TaxID=3415750 RepID=UPI003CC63A06